MHKKNSLDFYKISFWVLFVIIIFSTFPSVNKKSKSYEKLNHIEELYGVIFKNYQKSIPEDTLIKFLRNGLLDNLDPFTQYISKEELLRINEDFAGDFYGIGVQFTIIRDTVMVIKVIDNGPSYKSNILPGDRIISVNSKNFTGKEIDNNLVMNTLRGKKGEKVDIKVLRKNKELKKIIYRDAIPLKSIETFYLMNNNVGYLKLEKFSATTYYEFQEALTNLMRQGAEKLILDLRSNPGGYLQQAVDVTNEFLEGNMQIVSTKGDFRKKQTYYSNNKGIFKKGNIVVLINENSASASEILAGAIQDHDRGSIVGKKSFGKGLVQEQIPLKNGGSIRVTVSKYYTPSGRSIQKPYNFLDTIDNRKEFKTKGGRVVFSDGGITPDFIIFNDTMSAFESDYWNKNYKNLYEKAFDFADNNRAELTLDYKSFFKKNRENLFSEMVNLSKGSTVIYKYKYNLITQFENMILNNILSIENLSYHYNKDDNYLQKALEIIDEI